MAFHDVQFPPAISMGSIGGPERRTDIVTLASGHEMRSTPWAHARRRYDAGVGLRSLDDLAEVIAFFEARRGQLHGFRWKDWADYTSALPSAPITPLDQLLGYGDAEKVHFGLSKTYSSGAGVYMRPISCPILASLRVAVAGQELVMEEDFTWSADTIVFAQAPARGAAVTAGFEFDVPVRFDSASLQVAVSSFQSGQVPSLPVIEVVR